MSKEQKMDILKARFGEKISSSSSKVLPPWHKVYEIYDGKYINEDLRISNDIFKECVDSEYTQSKIFEFLLDNFSIIELTDMEKIKELEKRINSNDVFSKDKKEMLRKKLNDKYQEIMSINEYNRLHSDVIEAVKTISDPTMEISIENLDLSVRSYNILKRNSINSVKDLLEKTEKEILKIRELGKKSYYEVLNKMQSLGIEMEDGYFVNKNLHNEVLDGEIDTNIEKMKELEKRINSSEYISEEKKKDLIKLLYKPFNVTIDDNQDVQNSVFLEERSKEELIKHILEQQKTIAEQRKEIDELSSKKLEEI